MRIHSFLGAAACLLASFVQAEPLVKNGETVAFLGDSITQFGAQSPGGYVNLVASGLAANGVTIKLIPAGISGNKSDQMLARVNGQVIAKKPEWMTLSCGVNDVWHGARGAGISLEDYKKNITEIVDRCEKAGVNVMILTATQINLPVTNELNTKLIPYNEFLRQLATERKLPLADLNADMFAEQEALKAAGITNRSLTTDGVHMNTYGNIMMAKGVLKAFGLDKAQLATAEDKWQDIAGTYQPTIKPRLTLNDLAALEALAAKKKVSVDALMNDLTADAVKAAVAGQAGK